ncbi:enoyl-CoA hydratase/isomerase family protein, partial [bacterium]
DDKTKAIILYGGEGKSFCSGGDFNETSKFTGGEDVREWIDNVTETYKSVLSCKIPIIAAIDHYAIGFGLQLALLCDYRIGSEKVMLQMPELKKGIACNFGALILEHMIGRPLMQKMIFKCEMMLAEDAKNSGLIHDIFQSDKLLDTAINFAKELAQRSETAFRETKQTMNKEFIEKINNIKGPATLAHCNSFSKGIAQENMRKLLNKNHAPKEFSATNEHENSAEKWQKKICASKIEAIVSKKTDNIVTV